MSDHLGNSVQYAFCCRFHSLIDRIQGTESYSEYGPTWHFEGMQLDTAADNDATT